MRSIWLRFSAVVKLRWLALTLFVAMSGACGGVDPVLEIGLAAPFEGRYRDVGYDVVYSARLVIREVNAAGGVGPYRVELVALDDFGEPERAWQTAETFLVDPDVVAVIGHWLPETTATAERVYEAGGLAHVPAGAEPLGPYPVQGLSDRFRSDYQAVTPFDEQAGPYAGPAYDGMYLIIEAMRTAWQEHGRINRQTVLEALERATVDGVTGPVYKP
ncbi:MAG: ABC transporter substrate-binding protein [Candidatus Promineifilaceae bacterium]|nr:ABC transporter substrate-binding protein [Candidatus Promineifilaceae bacterium]